MAKIRISIFFLILIVSASVWSNELSCLGATVFAELNPTPVLDSSRKEQVRKLLDEILETIDYDGEIETQLYRSLGSPVAAPNCLGSNISGTIMLDVDLLSEIDNISDSVLVLLSHEVGHILQFQADSDLLDKLCQGESFEVKTLELLADFSAGYVFGSLKQDRQPRAISRLIARLADYEFSNPAHHGQVSERVNAWAMGQHAAFFGKPLDMAILLSNTNSFMNSLGGPPQSMAQSAIAQQRFIENAIEDLYQ